MTAVEWLIEQMQTRLFTSQNAIEILEQAKELEKQQIIDARVDGVCEVIVIGARVIKEDISKSHEVYYNETFNK